MKKCVTLVIVVFVGILCYSIMANTYIRASETKNAIEPTGGSPDCYNQGWCLWPFSCKTWGYLECERNRFDCGLGFGDCGCCDTMEGDKWPCRCNF